MPMEGPCERSPRLELAVLSSFEATRGQPDVHATESRRVRSRNAEAERDQQRASCRRRTATLEYRRLRTEVLLYSTAAMPRSPALYAAHQPRRLPVLWFALSSLLVICALARLSTRSDGWQGTRAFLCVVPCSASDRADAPISPRLRAALTVQTTHAAWRLAVLAVQAVRALLGRGLCVRCQHRSIKLSLRYGEPYLKHGFPRAQATLNILETVLNFLYLALAYRRDPVAVLIGFTAVVRSLPSSRAESRRS